MVFDKVRDIIVDQLSVDESMVAMDTNLMKDLEAEIPDEEAEKFQVVGDLVRYVEEQTE